MTNHADFWAFFNSVAAPRLAHREATFRKIFEYLDLQDTPITIVETGCARVADNWGGDGQSTVLFDHYIRAGDPRSVCHSVDISAASVAACRALVSPRVQLVQDDSVHHLWQLARSMQAAGSRIDLLYLDSYDLDMVYWNASAAHHLKELAAVMRCMDERTLVVVDDCPLSANYMAGADQSLQFFGQPSIGGKGRHIADFAASCGAKLEFSAYQAGWTGF